jgi:hypothetical protein
MYATLKLIINCHNLIVANSEVPNILHLSSCQLNDNAMHGFSHLIASQVAPMFAQFVFDLKKCKQIFRVLKICERLTQL